MTDQPVLRRDSAHRMGAGVCAGLARRFEVDPLVVRLVFVLATIAANGLGLLLYLLLWVALPSDAGAPRRHRSGSTARTLVFIGLAVATIGLLMPEGRSTTVVLALLAALSFVMYAARHRHSVTPAPNPGTPPYASYQWQQPPNVVGGSASPYPAPYPSPYPSPYPARFGPPPSPQGFPPPPAQRPRTWLWVLVGVATSVVALSIVGATGVLVPVTAYWAASLAVIGFALVTVARPRRAVHGRPRGLVATGLAVSLVTVALMLPVTTSASASDSSKVVTTAADLATDTELATGTRTIDLGPLRLDGDTTVTLRQDAGRLVVRLPKNVNTEVSYEVGIGEVTSPQNGTARGVDMRGAETVLVKAGAPTLTLIVLLDMGQLEVRS